MRVSRLLLQHMQANLTSEALSPAKLRFLYRLKEAGQPQPISYFTDGVFSNRSNATQMIDRLQSEGLVLRVRNPNDRRSILVELTDAGLQRLEEGHRAIEPIIQALLHTMTDAERIATLETFERVLNLLEAEQRRMDQELANNTS